jgi:hypothetical protein
MKEQCRGGSFALPELVTGKQPDFGENKKLDFN